MTKQHASLPWAEQQVSQLGVAGTARQSHLEAVALYHQIGMPEHAKTAEEMQKVYAGDLCGIFRFSVRVRETKRLAELSCA